MKPFIHNLDLIKFLPVMLLGYTLLYVYGVILGSGPVPPLHEYLDNLATLFFIWLGLFVVNTVLFRIEVRRSRR
jgi:hypothetical protein